MTRKDQWRCVNELIERLQYMKFAGSEKDFHIYQAALDLLRMQRKEIADSHAQAPYR